MSKVSINYNITDIVPISALKKKFKQYLSDVQTVPPTDKDFIKYKSGEFPKHLVISLVMVLEEILSDCLEYIKKHETTGLYVVDYSMVQMVLNKNNKYDFSLKYLKKYNSTFKYQDSVFFTYRKLVDKLESEYGDKLMIESDARNFIAYILSSLQYELIEMALMILLYSDRKTLGSKSLLCSYKNLFKEMYPKIKLKLDSLVSTKAEDKAENEKGEIVEDETEEAEEAEEAEETKVLAEEADDTETETETETEELQQKPHTKINMENKEGKDKKGQTVNKKKVNIVEEADLENKLIEHVTTNTKLGKVLKK